MAVIKSIAFQGTTYTLSAERGLNVLRWLEPMHGGASQMRKIVRLTRAQADEFQRAPITFSRYHLVGLAALAAAGLRDSARAIGLPRADRMAITRPACRSPSRCRQAFFAAGRP
jgi:hypothetical protein